MFRYIERKNFIIPNVCVKIIDAKRITSLLRAFKKNQLAIRGCNEFELKLTKPRYNEGLFENNFTITGFYKQITNEGLKRIKNFIIRSYLLREHHKTSL